MNDFFFFFFVPLSNTRQACLLILITNVLAYNAEFYRVLNLYCQTCFLLPQPFEAYECRAQYRFIESDPVKDTINTNSLHGIIIEKYSNIAIQYRYLDTDNKYKIKCFKGSTIEGMRENHSLWCFIKLHLDLKKIIERLK